MKNILLVFSLVICGSCHEANSVTTNVSNNTIVQRPSSEYAYKLFTLDDAQKILGESAHLKDSSSTMGPVFAFHSAYVANTEDKTTGRTGIIYFMFEEYADENSAHESYASIKKANEHNGMSILHGVGDEGYFSGAGGNNFRFALIRSGNKMIRLKINKTTANTSYDDFTRITEDVVHRL